MLSFLFWNIRERPIYEHLVNITLTRNADIVSIAEPGKFDGMLFADLLNANGIRVKEVQVGSQKIRVFVRDTLASAMPAEADDGLGYAAIDIEHSESVGADPAVAHRRYLVVFVHFRSKLWASTSTQKAYASIFRQNLEKLEGRLALNSTIVVGDFNMNPFDEPMIAVDGINAVMSRDIVRGGGRMFAGRSHPYLYNPMWNLLGDQEREQPGSFWFDGTQADTVYWHSIDQVILRPEVMNRFDHKSLKLLTDDGKGNALTTVAGRPKKSISDHLPLVFSIGHQGG